MSIVTVWNLRTTKRWPVQSFLLLVAFHFRHTDDHGDEGDEGDDRPYVVHFTQTEEILLFIFYFLTAVNTTILSSASFRFFFLLFTCLKNIYFAFLSSLFLHFIFKILSRFTVKSLIQHFVSNAVSNPVSSWTTYQLHLNTLRFFFHIYSNILWHAPSTIPKLSRVWFFTYKRFKTRVLLYDWKQNIVFFILIF